MTIAKAKTKPRSVVIIGIKKAGIRLMRLSFDIGKLMLLSANYATSLR
jgi:hypothetical protein